MIDFQTYPDNYKHWRLSIDGAIATLAMNVDETQGLVPGYELKLNSYDLGVDIELYDAIQRLRFEHPEVGAVIMTSLKERLFCAGANIRMLAQSSHAHKVNFCKFTNETRNSIEDASDYSHQRYLCALNGSAAGGGYELALACDHIMMVDDGSTAVSLPEVPLLAVLPGTGGLTRLVDKRKVRRDHADFFCTTEEGIRGKRAVQWNLIDEIVPPSKFEQTVQQRATEFSAQTDRPKNAQSVALPTLRREFDENEIHYPHLRASIDRSNNVMRISLTGPSGEPPADIKAIEEQGATFWPLALARELDDLLLHLRANEAEIGTLVFEANGDPARVTAYDQCLIDHQDHWLVREIILYWKRTLKRLEVTSRSMIALIPPGSCFAGILLEIVLSADRSYMLDGQFEDGTAPAASIRLSPMNFGPLPMVNGLTRLQSRFLDDSEKVAELNELIDQDLDAIEAEQHRLVTFIPDDIDWHDEVRIAIEERSSFSPDALTGMEASLRFAGPETLESKIFARLTAWQNWIFQRPNAVGEQGALTLYGSGKRSEFNKTRV